MPFDGSGNYTPSPAPNFPAVSGATVNSTYFNNIINDIATALSICLTRDNQGKPSANQDWNAKSLTNVNALGAVSGAFTGAVTVGTTLGVTGAVTLTASLSVGTTLGVTGAATFLSTVAITGALTLTVKLTAGNGGTGIDGSAAANGRLLIGNGAGYTLANVTSTGATIGITNGAGTISLETLKVPNALTVAVSGGAAAGTTFDGAAARTIDYSSVGALPNTPRVQSVVSAATVTPTFSDDIVTITAQAVALLIANPTGTAVPNFGQVIRIKDNGTARAITYGAQYRAIGVAAPTTTVINKTLYIGAIFNSTDTRWDIVSVCQEA